VSAEIPLSPREHGVLRIFALSMTPPEAQALRDPEAMAAALGIGSVDPAQAEVIALDDIGALGLTSYLTEGMGVKAEQVRGARARLDALDGHVLLLRSAAIEGAETALRPAPRLTLIATFTEEGPPPPPLTPLRSESAEAQAGGTAPAPEPVPRRGGGGRRQMLLVLVALAVIVVVALALGSG
jgi:hypothetical protein